MRSARLTLTLTDGELDYLRKRAIDSHQFVTELVRRALSYYLDIPYSETQRILKVPKGDK